MKKLTSRDLISHIKSNFKMAKRKIIKTIKVDVDLDKALGNAAREQSLAENPDGFTQVTKVHTSKKTYTRKSKHKTEIAPDEK